MNLLGGKLQNISHANSRRRVLYPRIALQTHSETHWAKRAVAGPALSASGRHRPMVLLAGGVSSMIRTLSLRPGEQQLRHDADAQTLLDHRNYCVVVLRRIPYIGFYARGFSARRASWSLVSRRLMKGFRFRLP